MKHSDMADRLNAFVQEHPSGWDHGGWLGLLSALETDGADVSDPDGIGRSLEQARLATTLRDRRVQGLGPKRIQAMVDRFVTLWSLQHATVEEIAEIPTIPVSVATKVRQALD